MGGFWGVVVVLEEVQCAPVSSVINNKAQPMNHATHKHNPQC